MIQAAMLYKHQARNRRIDETEGKEEVSKPRRIILILLDDERLE